MNYFFALELPSDIRSYMAGYCRDWQVRLQSIQSIKWALPEDYHVTLKFLGNVEKERVSELIAAALPIANQQSSLTVQLAPAGKFPTVLWLGVMPDDSLEKLAARLDIALKTLGFKPEYRPYRPHITAARWPQKQNSADAELLAPYERTFPSWTASHFVLMQTLLPEQHQNTAKARYNIVHTFPFGTMPL